jgi:hypothetical protein
MIGSDRQRSPGLSEGSCENIGSFLTAQVDILFIVYTVTRRSRNVRTAFCGLDALPDKTMFI